MTTVMYFNGIQVEYERHGIPPGHAIGPDHNNFMIIDMTRNFIVHLNGILDNFGFCELYTKYQLFVSYCTSCYGTCLLQLQHKAVNVFSSVYLRKTDENSDQTVKKDQLSPRSQSSGSLYNESIVLYTRFVA